MTKRIRLKSIPQRSARIGVFGYFGGRNLGDDLMLESLLGKLGTEVTLFARDANEVEDIATSELEIVTASVPSILRRLPTLSHLVRCGGTVFHDEVGQPPLRMALNYGSQVALLVAAKLAGARPALLGIGIGKVERRTTRLALLAALRLSDPVVFRDQVSFEMARELGFHRGVLGVDLALTAGSVDTQPSRVAEPGVTKRVAACPVDLARYGINWHGASQVDGWVTLIATCARSEEGLAAVDVVAFKDNERESDVPICQLIVEGLSEKGFDAVLVERTEARAAVKDASLVFAARFHAGILAAMNARPLVLVPYNQKIRSLGSDLGISEAVVEPERPLDSVTPRVPDISGFERRAQATHAVIKALVA